MSEKLRNINQRIDLLCDEVTLDTPSLEYFNSEKEDFTVEEGYGDKDLKTLAIIADEWTISGNSKQMDFSVKGRDKLRLALDTTFMKTYLFWEPVTPPQTEFNEDIPYAVGRIMASQVATEACTEAGLRLVWDAPDYEFVNELHEAEGFNDKVSDVLISLIEPLQHTEMYRTDISVKDNVVYVKKRKWPMESEGIYDISLADIRLKNVNLSKINSAKVIKNIYLKGQDLNAAGIGGWWVSSVPDEAIATEDIKDINGNLFQRIFNKSYTIFGNLVKKEKLVLQAIGGSFNYPFTAELTTVEYEYEEAAGSAGGRTYLSIAEYKKITREYRKSVFRKEVNNVVYLLRDETATKDYTYSADDEILTEIENVTVKDYGSKVKETKGKEEPPSSAYVQTTKQTIISHKQISKDLVETTTNIYENGILKTSTSQTTAGLMPGPRKVSRTINTSGNGLTTTWQEKIEVNPEGKDIKLFDDRFTQAQLHDFALEMKDEDKNRQKYELSLDLLPMPWLRKGMGIRIAGVISDGLGRTLDISDFVFFITGLDRRRRQKEYVGSLTGVTWV